MTTSKRDDEMPVRDPRFDTAWRAASSEEPSAVLDAAILAAARREVGAGPQPVAAQDARSARSVRRQWWPLAAAATLGAIAAGLLQLVPPEELGVPVAVNEVVTDMPAPPVTSASETATLPTQGEARKDTASAGANDARPAQPSEIARQAAPAARMKAQPEAGTVAPAVAALPEPFPAAAPKRDGSLPPAVPKPEEPRPVPSPKREAVAMAEGPPAAAPPPAGPGVAPSPSAGASVAPAPPAELSTAQSGTTAAAAEHARARGDTAALGKLASEPGPATLSASAVAPRSAIDTEPARPSPQARVAAAAPRLEAAADARAKDRAPLPVAEWIALIRRLRAEGKIDDAARELAAFRTAHADHERLLPADLRDWRPAAK